MRASKRYLQLTRNTQMRRRTCYIGVRYGPVSLIIAKSPFPRLMLLVYTNGTDEQLHIYIFFSIYNP